MIAQSYRTDLLPALLAGTARQPIASIDSLPESDPNADLKALSLTGQALRFEPPTSPSHFVTETKVQDARMLMPAMLRKPFLRLLTASRPGPDVLMAIAWCFDRLKMRPHPFDLPRMEAFSRSYSEFLGTAVRHWLEQQEKEPSQEKGYFEADDLSDETWTEGSLAQRVRYLYLRRQHEPAIARALLESTWATESADSRVRLLDVLQVGLSLADKPFLEGLEKDRAPRVRNLAQRLLSRLPGHSGQHAALQACLERIKRTDSGLLRKRPQLALEIPATVKEQQVPSWITETFADVSWQELAQALDLSEREMIRASSKDKHMQLVLALLATQDARLDLLEELVGELLPDAWEWLALCPIESLGRMTPTEGLRWAEILTQPYVAKPPATPSLWSWLHRLLHGYGPENLFSTIVRSPKWLEQLQEEEKLTKECMEVLASLCPPSQRQFLRIVLEPFDFTLTTTALSLMELLDGMEKTRHHA